MILESIPYNRTWDPLGLPLINNKAGFYVETKSRPE